MSVPHEYLPQQPEQISEYELFRDRVQRVQAEAVEGAVPTKFLASVEMEIHIATHAENGDRLAHTPIYADLLHSGPRDEATQEWIKEHKVALPNREMLQSQLFPEEQSSYEEQVRDEARAMVAALPAASPQQEQKRAAWMANIDTFTTMDLINFKVYQEFSKPTLGETAPPVGASYADMQADGDRKGWIEFRFGNGVLQEGYYDNPTVTEMRLTPCPPDELVEREEIIRQRILEVTTQFNGMLLDGNTHINMSAYHYDAASRHWLSAMREDNPDGLLDAASGIAAAIEDGLTLTETLADQPKFYGPIGGMKAWEMSQYRDSIRVKDGYIELRDASLKASTAHGVLWMMAGMMEGFESGCQALAKRGHTVAERVKRITPEKTESFDKRYDLQLLRALEQSKPRGAFLELDGRHAAHKGKRIVDIVTGWQVSDATGSFISTWLIFATQYDTQGKLSLDPNAPIMLEAMLDLRKGTADELTRDLEIMGIDSILSLYSRFLARDAVRLREGRSMYANPQLPNDNREGWERRWSQSPIMQRAYGQRLDEMIAIVGPVIGRNQAPADLTDDVYDPENWQRLVAHYRIGQP